MDATSKPMSDERLAKLWNASSEPYGRHFRAMLREALAEVERLRTREARLTTTVEMANLHIDELIADKDRLWGELEAAQEVVAAVAEAHSGTSDVLTTATDGYPIWTRGQWAYVPQEFQAQARALLASRDGDHADA